MRKLGAAFILVCACVGCKSIPVVNARAFYDAVAPEYKRYVEQDERFNDRQRANRLRTLVTHNRLLTNVEGE